MVSEEMLFPILQDWVESVAAGRVELGEVEKHLSEGAGVSAFTEETAAIALERADQLLGENRVDPAYIWSRLALAIAEGRDNEIARAMALMVLGRALAMKKERAEAHEHLRRANNMFLGLHRRGIHQVGEYIVLCCRYLAALAHEDGDEKEVQYFLRLARGMEIAQEKGPILPSL